VKSVNLQTRVELELDPREWGSAGPLNRAKEVTLPMKIKYYTGVLTTLKLVLKLHSTITSAQQVRRTTVQVRPAGHEVIMSRRSDHGRNLGFRWYGNLCKIRASPTIQYFL
jgi:hypothetical protein